MKSFIVILIAMFATVTAFSQKAKQNSDTTLHQYVTYSCNMHPQYVSNVPAKCPVCNNNMNLSGKEIMKMQIMKLYTCPMDNMFSVQSGKCPKCGMDLVPFSPKNKPASAGTN
ncbi:MAG TPA: heavy metal-binding domain-containing protein [Parafilimonas sp.]|nr:heavy metal-binding domain-containing protein [Parafilimonas sp.]